MRFSKPLAALTLGTGLLLTGCMCRQCCEWGARQAQPVAWRLDRVGTVEGLELPECVLVDAKRDQVYVSNMQTEPGNYWQDDGKGFLSLLAADGTLSRLHWIDSSAEAPIDEPKGMAILGDYLYFSDNTRVKRARIETAGPVEVVDIPKGRQFNDMVSDNEAVYVSDSGTGKILRIDLRGAWREIPSPPAPNGLTFHEGRFLALSFENHELYECDPAGEKAPVALGLPEGALEGPDGIEALEDGSFLISDIKGNKVVVATPDAKSVRVVAEGETPADIGLDRRRGLLFVPYIAEKRVVIYKMARD